MHPALLNSLIQAFCSSLSSGSSLLQRHGGSQSVPPISPLCLIFQFKERLFSLYTKKGRAHWDVRVSALEELDVVLVLARTWPEDAAGLGHDACARGAQLAQGQQVQVLARRVEARQLHRERGEWSGQGRGTSLRVKSAALGTASVMATSLNQSTADQSEHVEVVLTSLSFLRLTGVGPLAFLLDSAPLPPQSGHSHEPLGMAVMAGVTQSK